MTEEQRPPFEFVNVPDPDFPVRFVSMGPVLLLHVSGAVPGMGGVWLEPRHFERTTEQPPMVSHDDTSTAHHHPRGGTPMPPTFEEFMERLAEYGGELETEAIIEDRRPSLAPALILMGICLFMGFALGLVIGLLLG